MNLFDRYKFFSTLEARAAHEKMKSDGVPREALQLHLDEVIVNVGILHAKRVVEDAVRLYRGDIVEPKIDIRDAQPSGGTTPDTFFYDFRFFTFDKAREARSAILRITGCRDEGLLQIEASNTLKIPAGHYLHCMSSMLCRLDPGTSETGNHSGKWRDILAAVELYEGKTPHAFEEWERAKRDSEIKFGEAKEKTDHALHNLRELVESGKTVLFRFAGGREVERVTEALIRSGVPPRGLSIKLGSTIAVSLDEAKDYMSIIQKIVYDEGGRQVLKEDELLEFMDKGSDQKIEIVFLTEADAKAALEALMLIGWAKEAVEIRDRSIIVAKGDAARLAGARITLKDLKGELVTKVGRVPFG